MPSIRLNKFIAESGAASRRKSEQLILQGRVTVDGKVVDKLGIKIDPEKNEVRLDGEILKPARKVYFLLNKPKGFVTTVSDEKGRATVLSLIKSNLSLFPVGRLDYNTTGALIITNDGDFANKLIHPSNNFKRVYLVKIDKPLESKHIEKMLKGVFLDGKKSKFLNVSFPKKNNPKLVRVTTQEGKYHFVKRMFSHFKYNVKALHRESIGPFTVKELAFGEYRKLSSREIEKIFRK